MGRKINNLIGQKFGRWAVIGSYNNKTRKWLCKCECGTEKMVSKYNLLSNSSRSCGCYNKDYPGKKEHGLNGTRIHRIWVNMRQRCHNKNNPSYIYYGGRGIKVIDKWSSFINFKNDMYNSYLEHVKKYGEKNTTIDRIDNNGNYCKKNCRWATIYQQVTNVRNNRIIIYKGKEYNISSLSKKLKLKYQTLYNQIFTYKYKDFLVKK